VEKLCKRNFQMNLEFIQWMKILHDSMVDNSHAYNADERLKQAGVKLEQGKSVPVIGGMVKRAPAAPPAAKKENVQPAARAPAGSAPSKAAAEPDGKAAQKALLEITDLKLTVDGLEKVRGLRARRAPPRRRRRRPIARAARACAHDRARARARCAGARFLL
jgi:hypothetical protein